MVKIGQKGTAKTASLRFYQLHWLRGVDAAILPPSPSDLGPYSHGNAGESRSVSERVSQACAYTRLFSKYTDRGNTEGLVRRGIRASPL
jgi:hypothetical protein